MNVIECFVDKKLTEPNPVQCGKYPSKKTSCLKLLVVKPTELSLFLHHMIMCAEVCKLCRSCKLCKNILHICLAVSYIF